MQSLLSLSGYRELGVRWAASCSILVNLTMTVEKRGRYPVNVRYPCELRNDPE